MGGFAVTNLLDPAAAQDAVTKAYGDANYAAQDLTPYALTNGAIVKTLQVSGGSSLAGTTVTVFNATAAADFDSTLNVDSDLKLGRDIIHSGNMSFKGTTAADYILISGGSTGSGNFGGTIKLGTNAVAGQLPNGDYVGGYIWAESTANHDRGFAFLYDHSPVIGNVSAYYDHDGNWVYTNNVTVAGTNTANQFASTNNTSMRPNKVNGTNAWTWTVLGTNFSLLLSE